MGISDKAVLVTGASSGIGEATAKKLAGEGADVAVAARRQERLESLATGLENHEGETLVVPVDVTDEEAVEALAEKIDDEFGRLDALVNNAGVTGARFLGDAEVSDLRTVVEVNLLGAMNVTRSVLPQLQEAGGDIVNISSANARVPAAGGGGYDATKAGLNGFAESLRKAVTGNVRVTTVMPGRVRTEIASWDDWDGEPLAAGDIADAVSYALSQPPHVSVNELVIRPTDQLYP